MSWVMDVSWMFSSPTCLFNGHVLKYSVFPVVKLLRYSNSFHLDSSCNINGPRWKMERLHTKSFPLPAKYGHVNVKLKLPHRRRREYTIQLVLICSDVLLMEGILHHLGYINPINDGMDYLRSIEAHAVFGFLRRWQDSSIVACRNHWKAAVHCAGCPIVVGARCRDSVKIPVGPCLSPRIQGRVMGRVLRCIKEAQLVAVLLFRSKDSDHMNHIWIIYSPCLERIGFLWTSLVSLFFFLSSSSHDRQWTWTWILIG